MYVCVVVSISRDWAYFDLLIMSNFQEAQVEEVPLLVLTITSHTLVVCL